MKGKSNLTNIKKNIKKEISTTTRPKGVLQPINHLKSFREAKTNNPVLDRLRKDNMNLTILNSRANVLFKKKMNVEARFSINEKISSIEQLIFKYSEKMLELQKILKNKGISFSENLANSQKMRQIMEIDKTYRKNISELMIKSNKIDNLVDLEKLLTQYEKKIKSIFKN